MEFPRVYVLGAGNLGLGLALALKAAGRRVLGVWNRGAPRRELAARLLGQTIDGPQFGPALAQADVILVAVADAAIGPVAHALAASGSVVPGAVVAHLSGCLPAAALGPMPGVAQGSMHPLLACPAPERGPELLRRAMYALEGDTAAVAVLDQIVSVLGGRTVRMVAGSKARYHAAAVMASNLVVSLVADAVHEGEEAGFKEASAAYVTMALGALEEMQKAGSVAALTGPVLRGDVDTVRRHLEALSPSARAVYQLLSQSALDIARQRGLSPALLAEMRALLQHP